MAKKAATNANRPAPSRPGKPAPSQKPATEAQAPEAAKHAAKPPKGPKPGTAPKIDEPSIPGVDHKPPKNPEDWTVERLAGLTAEDAVEILKGNTSNRPKRPAMVTRYKTMMLNMQWRTHLPIVIYRDSKGKLHNSQHTLSALVEAEAERLAELERDDDTKVGWTDEVLANPLSLDAVLIDGIDPADADLIDTGKTRTGGDIVFRKHLFNADKYTQAQLKQMSSIMATAAKIVYFRMYFGTRGAKPRSNYKMEHADMVELIDAYPALVDSLQYVFDLNQAQKPSKENGGEAIIANRLKAYNVPYLVALHFLTTFSQISYDDYDEDGNGLGEPIIADAGIDAANRFIAGLADQSTVSAKGNPCYEFAQWHSVKAPTLTDNVGLNKRWDAMIVAMNAFINEESLSSKNFEGIKESDHPFLGGFDPERQTA